MLNHLELLEFLQNILPRQFFERKKNLVGFSLQRMLKNEIFIITTTQNFGHRAAVFI